MRRRSTPRSSASNLDSYHCPGDNKSQPSHLHLLPEALCAAGPICQGTDARAATSNPAVSVGACESLASPTSPFQGGAASSRPAGLRPRHLRTRSPLGYSASLPTSTAQWLGGGRTGSGQERPRVNHKISDVARASRVFLFRSTCKVLSHLYVRPYRHPCWLIRT